MVMVFYSGIPVVFARCIGQRKTEQGVEYMISSESVALDCAGFVLIGDLAPGEAAFIDNEGHLHRKLCR